jgi:hypothetical protein
MRIKKIKDNIYNVQDALINGYDWQLVRKPGIGTYATVAGFTD